MYCYRFNFTPTNEEKDIVLTKFENDLLIPLNFEQTQPGYNNIIGNQAKVDDRKLNPQTQQFCKLLEIDDPVELILKRQLSTSNTEDWVETNMSESIINDSDLLEDVDESSIENSSINRSFKLNLPQPINVDGSDQSDSSENVTPSRSIECDSTIPDGPTGNKEEHDTPVKKFKRRNADMYANVE